MFITIEGIEGSGKSTNADFIVKTLRNLGINLVHTREPGGTLIAEKIRNILLEANSQEAITSSAELLLLFAARSQHLENFIKPALNAGKHVICERFTDASFAYQGGGRKIDTKYIAFLEDFVQQGFAPDLTFLLDVNLNVALDRIKSRKNLDRIEQEKQDFFQRAREVYLTRAYANPKKYYIIDASLSLSQVNKQIKDILLKLWQKN